MSERPEDDGDSWLGEIVKHKGQLWRVTSVQCNTDGTLWLWLTDHYGSGATTSAFASDVEVALQ